jgi:hypothetical protein
VKALRWPLALLLAAGAVIAAPASMPAADLAQARNYVLAACVMARYAGSPLAEEADAWAGGLVERGSLPGAAYPALAELARSAPEPALTRDGTPMRLQSCVDFVQAPGFASKVQRVLQRVRATR